MSLSVSRIFPPSQKFVLTLSFRFSDHFSNTVQGGSWFARDPHFLHAFFNQTTYNRWQNAMTIFWPVFKTPFESRRGGRHDNLVSTLTLT